MTISKDLFLSILAMDACNRGCGAGIADGETLDDAGNGIDGLGKAGSQTGAASVLGFDRPDGA